MSNEKTAEERFPYLTNENNDLGIREHNQRMYDKREGYNLAIAQFQQPAPKSPVTTFFNKLEKQNKEVFKEILEHEAAKKLQSAPQEKGVSEAKQFILSKLNMNYFNNNIRQALHSETSNLMVIDWLTEFTELNQHRIAELKREWEEMINLLIGSYNQIDYLNEKFEKTASSNAMLSKIKVKIQHFQSERGNGE